MRSLKSGNGFTLLEFIISALILLPLVGAIVSLFSTGVNYYGGEQRAAQMHDEARSAVEIMALEVAQAGTRRDILTTATQAINPGAQDVQVGSSKGFSAGDQVIVDAGANQETVTLTAVGANSVSANFTRAHAVAGGIGASITFYGLPYLTGVIPPAGLAPNSSVTANVLRFYGDFYDDGTLYYVEYAYNNNSKWITKSITPLSALNENASQVLIRNVSATTGPFTVDRWNKPPFRAGDTLRIPCIVSDLSGYVNFRLHRGRPRKRAEGHAVFLWLKTKRASRLVGEPDI